MEMCDAHSRFFSSTDKQAGTMDSVNEISSGEVRPGGRKAGRPEGRTQAVCCFLLDGEQESRFFSSPSKLSERRADRLSK